MKSPVNTGCRNLHWYPMRILYKCDSFIHNTSSSHYHIITLPHHHIITLSHHHIITLPHHHIITSSHYHIITLPHHHIITSSHYHIITLPHHHITTSPHHHIITLSHHNIIFILFFFKIQTIALFLFMVCQFNFFIGHYFCKFVPCYIEGIHENPVQNKL